jgi:hypothetical protein
MEKFLKMAFNPSMRPEFAGNRRALGSPLGGYEHGDSHHSRNAAVDGPADLAGHKAAGQHADALQEPYEADDHQEDAESAQAGFHIRLFLPNDYTICVGDARANANS